MSSGLSDLTPVLPFLTSVSVDALVERLALANRLHPWPKMDYLIQPKTLFV